jgi:hypothetical protein
MLSNLPPGVTDSMIESTLIPDEVIESMYEWFEKMVQPDLEGQPSYDDLNEKAQREYLDQYLQEKQEFSE